VGRHALRVKSVRPSRRSGSPRRLGPPSGRDNVPRAVTSKSLRHQIPNSLLRRVQAGDIGPNCGDRRPTTTGAGRRDAASADYSPYTAATCCATPPRSCIRRSRAIELWAPCFGASDVAVPFEAELTHPAHPVSPIGERTVVTGRIRRRRNGRPVASARALVRSGRPNASGSGTPRISGDHNPAPAGPEISPGASERLPGPNDDGPPTVSPRFNPGPYPWKNHTTRGGPPPTSIFLVVGNGFFTQRIDHRM